MAALATVKRYLSTYLQTQLGATIVAMPILIHWGLGVSVMTIVGNLVFTPLLTLFLLLCALIFVTEICMLPNQYIIIALEALAAIWEKLLALGQSSWIIHFARPHGAILLAMPLIFFWGLLQPWCSTVLRRLLFMTTVGAGLITCCLLQQWHNFNAHGCVQLAPKLYALPLAGKRKIIVIDEGYLSRKKSVIRSVDYEVNQQIAKQFGQVEIAEMRITKPTLSSFIAAERLCLHWDVDAVWLPFFDHELHKYAWRKFFDLKRYLVEHDIRFVRYQEAKKSAGRARRGKRGKRASCSKKQTKIQAI